MGRARLPFCQSLQNAKKIPRRIVRPDAIAREESIHTEEKTVQLAMFSEDSKISRATSAIRRPESMLVF